MLLFSLLFCRFVDCCFAVLFGVVLFYLLLSANLISSSGQSHVELSFTKEKQERIAECTG